jgi:tRNA-splicing ligase RtcB
MMAVKTNLTANDLPDNLFAIRSDIEATVPHGISTDRNQADKGTFREIQNNSLNFWNEFKPRYKKLVEKHNKINKKDAVLQLGTLGSGNHFIELCLDEFDNVWVMLHSGSRGFGNKLASYFIELAKRDMEKYFINLPDKELAYFPSKTNNYNDYVIGLKLASEYAFENRRIMMENVISILRQNHFPQIQTSDTAINCHHNYVNTEHHFGENVLVTRKGAVRARTTDLGIIPGSMGAKSFIVRGKGNANSFCSCSHGAGRIMSRTKANETFTIEEHINDTKNIECRKDIDVLDETPKAYKNIDDVMNAQKDLIEIVHTLKQIVCVKG